MASLRALMPALSNKCYFNYGGQGPLPNPSLEAITASWIKIQELGPFTNCVWPYVENEIAKTRHSLATLCGVTSKRLALTENVTTGCVLPLLGLPFSSGDQILISDCEHPGVVSACKELALRKNLKVDVLPVQILREGRHLQNVTDADLLSSLEKHLKPNTRLVVLSHLLWNTGQLMPIKAVSKRLLNHPNKPFLLVDAAQSFGQIPVEESAEAADIFAFTGHKWACGPEGLGGVAISQRVLAEANPTLIGWRSLKHEGSRNVSHNELFHRDSRRFEIATSCIPLLAGLRCSLELLEKECPINQRKEKIQSLSTQLWSTFEGMKDVNCLLKGPPPAGLISFKLQSAYSPRELIKKLGNKSLWIRDLEDPLCLRACVHITSTQKEIIDLCEAINTIK